MNFAVYIISLFWLRNFLKVFDNVSVLEIGSLNVNGSLRKLFEVNYAKKTRIYVGLDLSRGPGVDIIADCRFVNRIFRRQFDIVICTEVLEHIPDPLALLCLINNVLRRGGLLILSTRSPGFPIHCYPADYWRFTKNAIILLLEATGFRPLYVLYDPQEPGLVSLSYKAREVNSSTIARIENVIKKCILPSSTYANIKISYKCASSFRKFTRLLLEKFLRFLMRVRLYTLFKILSVIVFKGILPSNLISSPPYRIVLLELLTFYARSNCSIRILFNKIAIYCENTRVVVDISDLITRILSLKDSIEERFVLINRWRRYNPIKRQTDNPSQHNPEVKQQS